MAVKQDFIVFGHESIDKLVERAGHAPAFAALVGKKVPVVQAARISPENVGRSVNEHIAEDNQRLHSNTFG